MRLISCSMVIALAVALVAQVSNATAEDSAYRLTVRNENDKVTVETDLKFTEKFGETRAGKFILRYRYPVGPNIAILELNDDSKKPILKVSVVGQGLGPDSFEVIAPDFSRFSLANQKRPEAIRGSDIANYQVSFTPPGGRNTDIQVLDTRVISTIPRSVRYADFNVTMHQSQDSKTIYIRIFDKDDGTKMLGEVNAMGTGEVFPQAIFIETEKGRLGFDKKPFRG